MTHDYAMFRLPYDDHYTLVEADGPATELESIAEIGRERGFVMAPFAAGDDTPVLFIRPGKVERLPVENISTAVGDKATAAGNSTTSADDLSGCMTTDDGREDYARDFRAFHDELTAGRFGKIVLARRATVHTTEARRPEALFMEACRLYPRMMVAMTVTQRAGTWLAATPEILLECCGRHYATMALAGTMRVDCQTEWSAKNREEQAIVADYIRKTLEPMVEAMDARGPYTVRAGQLVHLRTDFDFRPAPGVTTGQLVAALHPTPAVCGIPPRETRRFIMARETAPRKYYSGFAGPVYIDGQTRLYVTLRCMEIKNNTTFELYAGGGLLADSREDDEWRETENKMETMKRCIATKNI